MRNPTMFLVLASIAALLTVGSVQAQTPEVSTPCAAGSHLFSHEYLATAPLCIPDHPLRVVVLDEAALELALYTNIDIVGTGAWAVDELKTSLPQLAAQLDAIPDMGYPADPEAVLKAKPDLIVSYSGEDMIESYDEMSKIAPVVTTTLSFSDWERTTEFYAEVFGAQDIFESMKATWDARVKELQDLLPDRANMKVSVTTAMSYGPLIWMDTSAQGKILADVGFGRPASQIAQPGDDVYKDISDETLNLADGDAIFLFTYATTDPETYAKEDQAVREFQEKPLWKTLNAVRNDQVYVVGPHWYRATTYLLANLVLDDLFTHLAHTHTTIVDPLDARLGLEAPPAATEAA